jgi:adenosylmethionine---8-amino-7-oxononanoate aminotransferase
LLDIKQNYKVRDARSFGCIAAIELETEGATSYFNDKGKHAYNYFLERGIILRPLGNVIALIPPYCIKQEDLTYIFDVIKGYLKLDI